MVNAKIWNNNKCTCKSCGWPVVDIICNDGMGQIKPYSLSDYWMYCSNKTCSHHEGEGYSLQFIPDFVRLQ